MHKSLLLRFTLITCFYLISNLSFSQITISPCAKLTPIHVVVIGSSTAVQGQDHPHLIVQGLIDTENICKI